MASPLSIILVALGAAAACGKSAVEISQASDRNVLLITIDTLRGDALGCDGGPARTPNIDCAGRRRHPFLVRARAGRRHAALAREHPHRPLPVSARLPREQRLSADARRPDAGDAPEGERLQHRRVRRRLSARRALRADAGLRHLRRPLRRCGQRRGVSAARAPGAGRRRAGRPVDPAARRPLVRVGARLRSARAVPAAAALRSRVRRAAVLRRGRGGRPGARTAAGYGARLVAIDARRGDRRSRRVARRARRADARPLRVRIDIARAADHRGGRRGAAGRVQSEWRSRVGRVGRAKRPISRRGTSTSCRRFSTRSRSRFQPICRATRCARAPIATAAPRAPRTSKRWSRCSTSGSRRSTACWSAARNTSGSRCRSSTTSPPIAASAATSWIAPPSARGSSPRGSPSFTRRRRARRSRSRPRSPPASARSATSRDRPRRSRTTASRTIRSGSSRSIA